MLLSVKNLSSVSFDFSSNWTASIRRSAANEETGNKPITVTQKIAVKMNPTPPASIDDFLVSITLPFPRSAYFAT